MHTCSDEIILAHGLQSVDLLLLNCYSAAILHMNTRYATGQQYYDHRLWLHILN